MARVVELFYTPTRHPPLLRAQHSAEHTLRVSTSKRRGPPPAASGIALSGVRYGGYGRTAEATTRKGGANLCCTTGEHPYADVTTLPPLRDGNSPIAKLRRQLLAFRGNVDNPFPKHVIPRGFVDFLRERTHVPASYAATTAAAIIRAGLDEKFTLERARAAMLAYVLRVLHFYTPQSMMPMRVDPPTRDRCHVCDTWVMSRWGISDAHGSIARELTEAYDARDRTKTGERRPAPLIGPGTRCIRMPCAL
jgi:hypothetical protein